jgi:hypothetical protein
MSSTTNSPADAGDARRLDADGDDPSSFKDFVVYVINDNPACEKLLNMLRSKQGLASRTWVQDVKVLREKPAWLNGVPIVVEKAQKKAFRGTSAFTFVSEYKDEDMSFGGFGSSSSFAFDDGKDRGARSARMLSADMYGLVNPHAADPSDADQAKGESRGGMREASGGDGGMDPPSADVGEKQSRRKGLQANTNAATEAYLNARQAVDARVKEVSGGGGMQQRVGF